MFHLIVPFLLKTKAFLILEVAWIQGQGSLCF